MKILLDTEIDQYKWAYILENSPYASPFQTKKYYDFINAVQGFRAMAVAIEHQGRYCALAVVTLQKESGIKGYFSRRGIIYGGPVFDPQNSIALGVLLEHLYSILKKDVIYLETRNLFNYSSVEHIFEKLNWQYVPYINFQIETTDTDQVKSKLSNSRKRQIKNALQSGATWRIASNLNEVEEFYKILLHLYSQRIKKPLPSWDYFNQFYEMQVGKIIVIIYEGKVIGGIICPLLENRVIYEFYICGLDDQYKAQYPSVLATWAAVEYALQNHIPKFDFMGAGKTDEAYGVREFKARFGGELVEHGRFLQVTQPRLYALGKMGLKLMAKIH